MKNIFEICEEIGLINEATVKTAEDFISACQKVVKDGSYTRINNTGMDITTANMVVRVWKKLNKNLKEKLSAKFVEFNDPKKAVRWFTSLMWKAVK